MSGRMILMRLGSWRFSITEFNLQEMMRRFEFRWEQLDRVGRRPALQFLGPGAEEVTLKGVIYPHYFGGVGQYKQMRNSAKSGTPYNLATGTGSNLGKFCIVSMEDTSDNFVANGKARKVQFDITLKAYGEDGGGLGGFLGSIGSALFGSVSRVTGGIVPATLGYALVNQIAGRGGSGAPSIGVLPASRVNTDDPPIRVSPQIADLTSFAQTQINLVGGRGVVGNVDAAVRLGSELVEVTLNNQFTRNPLSHAAYIAASRAPGIVANR